MSTPRKRRDPDLVALDDALDRLSALDARQGRLVELRFFGGLTVEETAAVLGIAPITVKRDWALARTWLYRELRGGPRMTSGVGIRFGTLFHQALSSSQRTRDAFVREHAGDAEVRREVLSLLRAHPHAEMAGS